MADMFYFRSPTSPRSIKDRTDARHQSKVSKRRRSLKMEGQTQRACVARIEEPVFSPSSLTSLIPCHTFDSWPESGVNKDSTSVSPADADDNQDVNKTTFNEDGVVRSNDWSSPERFPSQAGVLPSSHGSQQRYHPRPESHDIAQEENGRRTRLAMEDANEYTGLLQRLLHLSAAPSDRIISTNEWSRVDETMFESLLNSQQLYTLSIANNLPVVYAHDTDDEALPVDDPRRDYDFNDFMRRRSSDDSQQDHDMLSSQKTSPSFTPALDDVIRSDIQEGDVDIQGLRWNYTGHDRDQILRLRREHHPSRRSIHPARRPELFDDTCASEVQYRFRSFSPRHRANYSHYQLRNVLAAVNRNDIFYSTGNQVMQTSLACPSIENTIMNLSNTSTLPGGIRITCLSATTASADSAYCSDKVLLAGGFGGEYAILDLNSERQSSLHTGFVTHDYNGLVTHVSSYADRCSGQLRASFCSNDGKVRIMDVKTNRFINSFSYDNATNSTALSPDGRLRALVGDSNETLITDADKGTILITLKEHKSDGFACAWSDDGRHVATGAQDGLVVLWDARNWSTPLQTMDCLMSTARSLHFTFDGALIVGEDDDVVTIYDTRRPDIRQDIRFFGSIAGVALLDGGDEMVIANADKTVGGLMSFQRTAQGFGYGTFGECINDRWFDGGSRSCHRSVARAVRHRSEMVSEMVV